VSTMIHEYPPADELGDARRLPDDKDCPHWCPSQHAEHFLEVVGDTVYEASQHFAGVAEMTLGELRNYIDGRLSRPGGSHVDVALIQYPHPSTNGGFNGPPLVELELSTIRREQSASVELTTGEARSLAAALLRAAELGEDLR